MVHRTQFLIVGSRAQLRSFTAFANKTFPQSPTTSLLDTSLRSDLTHVACPFVRAAVGCQKGAQETAIHPKTPGPGFSGPYVIMTSRRTRMHKEMFPFVIPFLLIHHRISLNAFNCLLHLLQLRTFLSSRDAQDRFPKAFFFSDLQMKNKRTCNTWQVS